MAHFKPQVVAIITTKRNKILSIGHNSYIKTHPLQAKLAKKVNKQACIYLHAEIDAMIRCKDKKGVHKITIIRTNKKGELRYAKPCTICEYAIKLFGIKCIAYS